MLKVPQKFPPLENAHQKWLDILEKAQETVKADEELQKRCREGQTIQGRAVPPEVLGRSYAAYCSLINQMYDAYLNSVHLQRSPYILGIVNMIVKRLYELRNELVHLIVNDYIYVDAALAQLKMTPFDIQIVVPYHFPLECRSENAEQALQKMWADAIKRKRPKIPKQKPKPATSTLLEPQTTLMSNQQIQSQAQIHDDESDDESTALSVHTLVREEYVQALLIQKQERFRQWYMQDFRQKCINRRRYFAVQVTFPSEELKHRAARLIQRVYREVMKIKRKRVQDEKRDMLLGMIPEPKYGKLNFTDENNKVYERRRKTKLKITETYLKELEKQKARLLLFKWDGQVNDITDQIREWFKEWYYGYGFFPEYPYEVEGGTILVLTGDYPTVEEQKAADLIEQEKNKGKTPEMLKEEKEKAKSEAKRIAEEARIQAKKDAIQLFKLKCNPADDPGYQVQNSDAINEVIQAFAEYYASWSLSDRVPAGTCGENIYGYMKPLLIEGLLCEMHKDCRKYVDELMRLELKLLITAHKQVYRSINKEFPKSKPRKKPKVPPVPKLFELNAKVKEKIEPLYDLDIITKPKTKFCDVFGDLSFANYDYSIRDPDAKFLPPAYGDVKDRVMMSCVMACGIQPGATRNRSVMLLGPPRNGKSFLIDAVAGELNAVKIDITPEVFSAVVSEPSKLLNQVFVAAKAFEPAVIYMKNIERVFTKKVPPQETCLNATQLQPVLPKLVKQITDKEKIIFIATCSNPSVANNKMAAMFDEIILVPRTDYGSISKFFFDSLQKESSVPKNFPFRPLAQLLRGYGFGMIIETYREVMCPERIVSMNVKPLAPTEFLEVIVHKGEPLSEEEYQEYVDFYLSKSSMGTEKKDYEEINKRRAEYYKKMEKDKKGGASTSAT